MGFAHRHSHQIAGSGFMSRNIALVVTELDLKIARQNGDPLILRRMNVGRHKGPVRNMRVPDKRIWLCNFGV